MSEFLDTDLELDNFLDKLEGEWHYRFRDNLDFEPMDYDFTEGAFYRGLTVDEAITEYVKINSL